MVRPKEPQHRDPASRPDLAPHVEGDFLSKGRAGETTAFPAKPMISRQVIRLLWGLGTSWLALLPWNEGGRSRTTAFVPSPRFDARVASFLEVRSRPSCCLRMSLQHSNDENQPNFPGSPFREHATTFVPIPGEGNRKAFVEIGSTNTKREFIVDQHLLGILPERADNPQTLGSITLVGAGPGDPDLLTVAAVKAIKSADLVVADRLVSEEILLSVECELKVAQKHPGCALQAQNEIYRWCIEGALAGRRVVRLKIGDPFVFGRGAEEVLEFRRFGVEARVIPGISSALAAPLAAGIPITHRGVASRVVVCTGMGQDETAPDVPPYHPAQTIVFLMAVGRLGELCRELEASGHPPDTPVALVERATTPRQRTVLADLRTAAAVAAAQGVRPPAAVVVGRVVDVLRPSPAAAATAAAVDDGKESGMGGGGAVVGAAARREGRPPPAAQGWE